jgi:hypothetical protein
MKVPHSPTSPLLSNPFKLTKIYVKPKSSAQISTLVMGRITPSFRQLFLSEVEELKRTFYRALLDPKHREAFDLLIRAWCSEDTAMGNAFIPCVLDNINLLANVDNKKCIEELRMWLFTRSYS